MSNTAEIYNLVEAYRILISEYNDIMQVMLVLTPFSLVLLIFLGAVPSIAESKMLAVTFFTILIIFIICVIISAWVMLQQNKIKDEHREVVQHLLAKTKREDNVIVTSIVDENKECVNHFVHSGNCGTYRVHSLTDIVNEFKIEIETNPVFVIKEGDKLNISFYDFNDSDLFEVSSVLNISFGGEIKN